MKYFMAGIVILFWFCFTFVLAISVVGWIVLAEDSYFEIPNRLLETFEK